ncbi:hypothetical protein D915_004989 [Fasciola hepatica]|uniref:Uncharacterized protein n=1 Tax=Fasciola hepatica TaxID=6192 RepID=A0A4E0RD71_FASHE|nr:hypothetical protein D915_004989 [Fasciola hepatica]
MHMDSLVPPPEPYKAATTIVQGQKIMPALPKGVRRIESRLFAADPGTPAYCLPKARFHCPGIVVREQPVVPVVLPSELTSSSSVRIKPTAAVLPTTSSTSSPANSVCNFSIHAGRASGTVATTSVEIQTDDVGIDMDLLFHIEDLLRTQRSLTLPMSSSRFASAPVGCGATNPDRFSSHLDSKAQTVKLQQRIEELQEALGAQSKVNADLKRLLVSALAGNSTVADQLIGLTSDNVNLSGQSRSLAAQQAALTEVANTAGIAADVWRAKCLAGRVIATEAARRVALAERKAQLARHALAHLLGERARLRVELGQACASLIAATSPDSHPWHPDEVGTTPPIVQDTLGLAALCTNLVDKHICQVGDRVPILCQSDSPGENLALRVLTNSFPTDVLSGRTDWRASVNLSSKTFECASSSTSGQKTVDFGDSSLIPPPAPPDTEDLIQQALKAFTSTQFLGTEHACLSSCKGCRGEVSVV